MGRFGYSAPYRRMYGLGQAAGEVEKAAATGDTVAQVASDPVVAAAAVTDLAAENKKLKEEIAALKKSMGKLAVGFVAGGLAGYWYRGRRGF